MFKIALILTLLPQIAVGASEGGLVESKILKFKHQLTELSVAEAWVQGRYDPHRWLAMADFSFYQKDSALALKLYHALPAPVPEHMRYVMKGIYEASTGNVEAAQALFDSVTRAADRVLVSRGYYFQGELIYQGIKNPTKTSRELERMHYFLMKAVGFNPELGAAHFGIARHYIHQQKWDMAIKQLEGAVQVDPMDALSLYNWGVILAQKRQWGAAYEYLGRAYQLRPLDSDVLRELIPAAYYSSHTDVARKALGKMLRLSPAPGTEVFPMIQLVLFRDIEQDFNAGQVQKALDQYLALEKQFPQVPDIQIRIGMCYRSMGPAYFFKAKGYFEAYIKRLPHDPKGYFELGVLEFDRSDKARASHYFLQALSHDPTNNGNTWLWLYKGLNDLKLQEEALFVLGKADMQPYLDIEYRDAVNIQKEKLEKDLKVPSHLVQGLTLSAIDSRLQKIMASPQKPK